VIRKFILTLILLGSSGNLIAEDVPFDTAKSQAETRNELSTMGAQIDSAGFSLQAHRRVSELRKRLIAIRSQALDCITDATANVDSLKTRRDALGEPSRGEDAGMAASRARLAADFNQHEKRRIACEEIAQISQDLFDNTQEYEQAALKARLFAHGISTPMVVLNALEELRAWPSLVPGIIDEGSGWDELSPPQRWSVIILFAVLFAAGIIWRRHWFKHHPDAGKRKFLVSAIPSLLGLVGICGLLTIFLPVWPPALITRLGLGIVAWVIIDVYLHIWLAERESAGLSEADAKSLSLWLRIPVGLMVLGSLLSTAEAVILLPDSHYFLLRTAMVWLFFAGVAWSANILGRVPGLAGTLWLRVFIVLVVFAVAVAETLGFRNLSIYVMLGVVGTIAGFVFFNLIAKSFTFLFDGMDEGHYQWQKTLRKRMALKAHKTVPGLIWIRLIVSILIWSVFALWVLWLWGQSELWISQMIVYAREGFEIGSLRIAPIQILGAIAVLAIGISLTRWIKKHVINDLVKRTRLDHGGREAIITVSGYVGVLISLLIAMGVAGISYTNLAIIAGALSVGIGFGLQNVVNNFVSGLILLFERPVRTGDWIVVGDTQGFVRKISIRSTQIETFDRADIIVPNSELISNKVSNLMLRDHWGRIIIPVGVAYGSDVQKVREILLQVAHEHDGVLTDQPRVAPPKALFMRFGDSALEFELRCFIRQIDKVFDTTSDMNIAIEQAFREAGITIPFPQRDVHIIPTPPEES
jgi:small-conductance mechanosensitive channel